VRTRWLTGVALVAVPFVCAAAPTRPDAQLEFHGDSTEKSCPTEAEFRDRVVSRLGFDPFVPSAKQTVAVRFRDDKQKVRAEVSLRAASGNVVGRRELVAIRAQCSELGESAAVAVSLLLDPLGTAASAAPAPSVSASAPASVVASVAPPPTSATPAPTPTAPPPAPVQSPIVPMFTIAAQLSFARGPGPTAGGRLGAGVRSERWSIGIEGSLDSTFGFVEVEGARVRALFATAGGLLCHAWPFLEGCAVASFGVVQGEAEGVEGPVARRTLAGFAGVRLGVPWCFAKHMCFVPTVDLLATLVRTKQTVDGGTAWLAPPLSISLGAAFRLP